MKNTELICTGCQKVFPADGMFFRCEACGEPLELGTMNQGKIREGNVLRQTVIKRYADFFPFGEEGPDISLGEGFTPLVESTKLAAEIGIKKMYFKNESQNPTWSFKDRGTLTGVLQAIRLGCKKIGTVSTGNMAVSVAAYGRKAGLETFILVSDSLPPEKLNPIAIYKPYLIKVVGDYGKLYYESLLAGIKNGIFFINSDAPFRVEGYKTLSFEICEQTNFDIPDYIIVPTSAGGLIRGIAKGFQEFKNCGLIEKLPTLVCAQASGCAPISGAYHEKRAKIERFENPQTIAHAIENPYPPSGNQVLRIIRNNQGFCVDVSEEEIITAQALLAQEGIFGQPASAVSLAAAKRLKSQGFFKGTEKIACVVTGSGLKYTAVFEKHSLEYSACSLDDLSKQLCTAK